MELVNVLSQIPLPVIAVALLILAIITIVLAYQYAKMQAAQLTRGMLESEYSLKQMICEMPTFLDVEKDDNFYYKVCHGEEGAKTHQQLSMQTEIKVCCKPGKRIAT